MRSGPKLRADRAPLEISLFGGFAARLGTTPLRLRSKKSQALLAYLAFFAGKSLHREALQALLWPTSPRSQAQASLRQTLLVLRKCLPARAWSALQTEGTGTIGLDASQIRVDVRALEHCVADATPEALERVPLLCAGPLLDGFSVRESRFDDWVRLERARLSELAVGALQQLLELQSAAGLVERAVQTALHSLRLDPREERTHRALIELYAVHGRRAQALQQYELCAATLRREFGVEPDERTQSLYRRLLCAPTSLAVRHDVQPSQASEPGLVGRDRELAELDRVLGDDGPDARRLVVLIGEAGVGKTRLAAAAASRAAERGMRIVRGRCFESEQVLPFALFLDVLEGEPAFSDESLWDQMQPALRAELSRIFPRARGGTAPSPRAPSDARLLFEAVGELLTLVARRTPLLVVLEDSHWADAMSLRLLSFLARRLPPSHAVRWLTTIRAENLESAGFLNTILQEIAREDRCLSVAVPPLEREETLALFRSLSAGGDDALVEQVWSLSEGNPLVVVETARGMHRDAPPAAASNLRVPERVRELVERRAARLTAESKELLAIAAVIGRDFDFTLLARASGMGDRAATTALQELVTTRFLQGRGERFSFSHDRIREIVYEGLLGPRRRVLHRGVALALEQSYAACLDGVSGTIGYHFAHAGDAAAAIAHLKRFAERSERSYGLEEAIAALSEAERQSVFLPVPNRHATAIDLATRRARCLFFLGRAAEMDVALTPHRSMMRELDLPELAAPFHVYLAMAHASLGNRRRVEEQETHLVAAVERCDDRTVVGMARAQLSYNALRAGRFALGIEYGVEAVQILSTAEDPELTGFAWLNLGGNYAAAGDCRRAVHAFTQAEEVGVQHGSARIESMAKGFRGCLSIIAFGELHAGLSACRMAVRLAPDVHSARYANWTLLRASSTVASFANDRSSAVLDDLFGASLRTMEASVSSGDPAAPGWAGLALVALSEARIALEDAAGAKALAVNAVDALRVEGDPLAVGWALRALGNAELLLGQTDPAEVRLREALQLFEDIAAPFERAVTLLLMGAVSAARNDGAMLTHALREAHHVFTALELPWWTSLIERWSGSGVVLS